jgi:catechol 2,3-dioxygenase-like lactoylglutathione lyase family enzyme
MTQTNTQNPHFSVSIKALTELDALKMHLLTRQEVEARCLEFAKRVLGEELVEKACFYDDEETGIFYFGFGDELELTYILGATPEDDYFLVSFLEVTSPRAARTMAGVGMAIQHAKYLISHSGMDINSYLEHIFLIEEE